MKIKTPHDVASRDANFDDSHLDDGELSIEALEQIVGGAFGYAPIKNMSRSDTLVTRRSR